MANCQTVDPECSQWHDYMTSVKLMYLHLYYSPLLYFDLFVCRQVQLDGCNQFCDGREDGKPACPQAECKHEKAFGAFAENQEINSL